MNWRVSRLDRFRLVSNSDAHSPAKLGREATAFTTPVDYFAMREALETGRGYAGTVEFFPEEGKYHHDGHRACGVRLTPEEADRCGGRCPVCGRPVTIGVLHRIAALADRQAGARPASAGPYRSFLPLPEILAEVLQVSAGNRRVAEAWRALLAELGPELYILERATLADLDLVAPPQLSAAIARMRRGAIRSEPGYDGVYGRVRCLGP